MNLFINIKDFLYYNRKIILVCLIFLTILFVYLFSVNNNYDDDKFYLNDDIYVNKLSEDILETYIVDIKGAIKSPGTYELEEGKRIIDVIDLAGGILESADLSNVNLSKKISDEMLIIIPELNKFSNNDYNNNYIYNSVSNDNNKVSINYDTLENLMTLNGIGEAKAQAIIDYRNNNGLFKNIEDVKKVSGIGNSTFEKIKDYIKL